ncbi:MAG: Gfo/Idh/MocA family oxidoreductase [bacterium]|jgi:predicted dehydrogenase|nr:Gfo/Idh/MocA family oxidoreductase [bacterium]
MPHPLRIGFIGAGNIVRTRHIPGLKQIEGVELVGVCNRGEASSRKAAKEFGIAKVFATWQDLVHCPDIDVVWIGTWPYMHYPITLEALEMDKHVFCQARMAMNLEEAQAMWNASQQTERVTMLCPPPFGMKGDAVMRRLLHQENILGDLYSIHFRALGADYLDPSTPLTWRQREDLSGLNTLTLGIYAEVIHRWFGYARTVTAQAKTHIPLRPHQQENRPVTRPDQVMVLSEMLNGALMRWEWSGVARPAPHHSVEAYGAKGAVRYDFTTDTIELALAGGDWQPVSMDAEACPWTVERDFIAAIREGKPVHPDFYDGYKYMQFTQAVFDSITRQSHITLAV